MTELFPNISDKIRKLADLTWKVMRLQKDPATAATFLHNVTEYYKEVLTEEEIEFLQFYFNLRMEMMKND